MDAGQEVVAVEAGKEPSHKRGRFVAVNETAGDQSMVGNVR